MRRHHTCGLIAGSLLLVLAGGARGDAQPAAPAGASAAGRFQRTITKNVAAEYMVFLPKDYPEGADRFPLILYLHGSGHRADPVDRQLFIVEREGPPVVAAKIAGFPFIVVSPQCPVEERWDTDVLGALLDHVIETYRVDVDRIYVTGLSMGGSGTWALAAASPDRFAAVAPVCGGGNPRKAAGMRNVPVWVFHGAQDVNVPISLSQRMVTALKACDGDVKFTVYPEAGHNSWSATYGNPALYEWFLAHRKGHAGEAAQIPPAFRQPLEEWKQRFAAITSTLPAATCSRTDAPPEINGQLDDACWRDAETISVCVRPDGLPADVSAEVRAAHDRTSLYLSFRCKEPFLDGLVTKESKHDGSVDGDDAVEVFLDTNLDRKTYFHFAVNANGVVSDAAVRDKTWQGKDVRVLTGREPDAWTLEMAIPLESVGLAQPAEGRKIGFNVTRTRCPRTWEQSQWSVTLGDHHTPGRFGTLLLK